MSSCGIKSRPHTAVSKFNNRPPRRRILDIGGQASTTQKLHRDEYHELNRKNKKEKRKKNKRAVVKVTIATAGFISGRGFYDPSFFFSYLSFMSACSGRSFSQRDLIHEKARCFSCRQ